MSNFIQLLKANEGLSGWAQFFGAMLALVLTYFTAFAPQWQRRRQLSRVAERLLLNGYEALESYHRTSANFLPNSISIRAAALSMVEVGNEIDRFPIFDLPDQGSRSAARKLTATAKLLKLVALGLEPFARELEHRDGTLEDQETIRALVGMQLKTVEAMIQGKELKRPEWPIPPS